MVSMPSDWILILAPRVDNRWPAVIGGYPSAAAAEDAGKIATMAHLTEAMHEDAGWGLGSHLKQEERFVWIAWRDRPWGAYTVTPGNPNALLSTVPAV